MPNSHGFLLARSYDGVQSHHAGMMRDCHYNNFCVDATIESIPSAMNDASLIDDGHRERSDLRSARIDVQLGQNVRLDTGRFLFDPSIQFVDERVNGHRGIVLPDIQVEG